MADLNTSLLQCILHLSRLHPDLSEKITRLLNENKSPLQLKYQEHRERFVALGGFITQNVPITSDFEAQAGEASGHYFHQDLHVASLINLNQPRRHIDIGSRIDGFVAHVASFRQIECLDIRELNINGHQNIRFLRADLMDINESLYQITDSISCLHALEHFGLGRYGDNIDPNGHIKGFQNILRMLEHGGVLYISFPISLANEVHFNAHRVFHPHDIFDWPGASSLNLERFDFVDDSGNLKLSYDIMKQSPRVRSGCGIYTFRKRLT